MVCPRVKRVTTDLGNLIRAIIFRLWPTATVAMPARSRARAISPPD